MSGLTATSLSFGEDCLTAHDRKSGAYSTASPEAQQVPRFRAGAPPPRKRGLLRQTRADAVDVVPPHIQFGIGIGLVWQLRKRCRPAATLALFNWSGALIRDPNSLPAGPCQVRILGLNNGLSLMALWTVGTLPSPYRMAAGTYQSRFRLTHT